MKHLRAAPKIEIPRLIDAVSKRDERRDNRSRACATDVIEIVGKDQLRIPTALAQLGFYPREDFDADNSANPSTVACKQFPSASLIRSVTVGHCDR